MELAEDEISLTDTLVTIGRSNHAAWRSVVGEVHAAMSHQHDAIERALTGLVEPRSAGVICIPTGGGKTRVGSQIVLDVVLERRMRVLWLAHMQELVDQAALALAKEAVRRKSKKHSVRIGRFQAGNRKIKQGVDIVVASIGTVTHKDNLSELLKYNRSFDLIVIDECHHTVARSWRTLVERLRGHFPETRLLGLSATPFRTRAEEDIVLQHIFNSTIFHEVSATELIEAKVLAKPTFQEVSTDEVLNFAGSFKLIDPHKDFTNAQLRQIAERQARNALMVDAFLSQRKLWGQTIFFACTIDHCLQIEQMLHEKGITSAKAVHGCTTRMRTRERQRIICDFLEGRVTVLISSMLLTEGTDLPKTQSIFMARPTRSKILFRQMIGRGLRGPKVNGTESCNIVIFSDTFDDHASKSLAEQLEWTAGLENVDLALRKLEREEIEQALKEAREKDPLLQEAKRRLREELEEEMRGFLKDDPVPLESTDRALLGWWETGPEHEAPQVILPYFAGYEYIKEFVELANEASASGTDLDVIRGIGLRKFISAEIYILALTAVMTAIRNRWQLVWVDIEAANESDISVARARAAPTFFADDYRENGRRLIAHDIEVYIRRVGRRIHGRKDAQALWRQRVAKSEAWLRLSKRAEHFYTKSEWKALVLEARALFNEFIPED